MWWKKKEKKEKDIESTWLLKHKMNSNGRKNEIEIDPCHWMSRANNILSMNAIQVQFISVLFNKPQVLMSI